MSFCHEHATSLEAGRPFHLITKKKLQSNETLNTSFTRVVRHAEIGHHLDRTIGAQARGGEPAAEDWNKRLGRLYFPRRYWWVRPFARPLWWSVSMLKGRAARKA